jgi:hypothetical protein
MRISALVLAAAMFAATPAFAQTDPAPSTEAPAAQEPAETTAPSTEAEPVATTSERPAQICRTIQRTESRLRTRRERICHTEAEWDQMQRDAANLVRPAPNAAPAAGN